MQPRVAETSWTVDAPGVALAAFVKARVGVAWSVAKRHVTSGKVFVDGARVTYPGEEATGEEGAGEEGGRLVTRAPFHLEATVRVLQRRPTNLIDVWDQQRYLRVLATPAGLALAQVVNHGTIDEPDVRFVVIRGDLSGAARAGVGATLRKVLGLDVDPAPLLRLGEVAHGLGPTVAALRGMRPPRFAGLFETFANVVPFQQVSLDSGVAIVRRLVERFGESLEHAGRRWYAFPAARVIAEARPSALRACGLSLRKAEALRRIAGATSAGEVTEDELARMRSAEAIRSLTALPGIGPWSASVILLRGLGRLDAFPPGDVGVARGLGALLRLPRRGSIDRVIEAAGDHRGYLYFCSLGAALLAKGLVHAAPPPRRHAAFARRASRLSGPAPK